MGDIITCNGRGAFTIVDYRHQRLDIIGIDQKINWYFFFDDEFKEYWQWDPYFEAVEKYGEPGYDECFGYEPLLSLGGDESVENLKIVNYKAHIILMSEFQGILYVLESDF